MDDAGGGGTNMYLMIITLWFTCGAITARLVSLEAQKERLTIPTLWYPGLVLLGPITAFCALIAGEAAILDELTR